MSNKCQRVFTLHAVTENHRLQKTNIYISHQALTYAGRGMVIVHFLPESQYPGRYRYINLSTNLQYLIKSSSFSNRINSEAIKGPSILGL